MREFLEELKSDKIDVRDEAARKLRKLGRAAVPEMKRALGSLEPEVAARVREILGEYEAIDRLGALVPKLRRFSFPGGIEKDGQGTVKAARKTFCDSGCGITDIGDVRLAVPGLTFTGSSSSTVTIKSRLSFGGGGGTGTGNRRFTHVHRNGVTTCTFGGFEFRIKGGKLVFGERKIPIGGGKTLVFLSRKGSVLRIVSLEKREY